MIVEVYADVVCPWCYIGERRLQRALEGRPNVKLRWRPFQLRPEMPAGGLPWREFAWEKFGGEESARAAFEHVVAAGAPDGVRFDFERVASAPNTVDAHRLLLLAEERGVVEQAAEALFRAYFTEGKNLNDLDELAGAVSGSRLDAGEARVYLGGVGGLRKVWASQEAAHGLGIGGVPFYVFDGRYAVSGAQPVEVFEQALNAASGADNS